MKGSLQIKQDAQGESVSPCHMAVAAGKAFFFDSTCICGKKMAVHLATDFWKGCWELVCGWAFRLVSIFARKWPVEFGVFLSVTGMLGRVTSLGP